VRTETSVLTTIGRRIKPINGLGMEYRSAVSSMEATTEIKSVCYKPESEPDNPQ
jgi:hypothetical protein